MFKSVFTKYLTVIMTLFLLTFSILLVILTTILGNYSESAKANLMSSTANAAKVYLEEVLDNFAPDRFENVLNAYIAYGEKPLDTMLNAYTANSEDLNVLLSDCKGKILYCTGSDFAHSLIDPNEVFPASLVQKIGKGETPVFERMEIPFFSSGVLVHAVGVYNDSEELCGIIAVTTYNQGWGSMAEELTRAIIVAVLVILLVSMIAIYVISERTTAPLRQMSNAARDFAAGHFDARIAVKGEDEVSELAVAFNQMAESLQNLETMRTSFVANVSHDLRTPMTTIAGFIDGIRDGVIPAEEHGRYLEIISGEVRRLSRLVTSLLDLSRIQAGDRKFTMRPFDICEMGRLILISFEHSIDEKQLEVEFETSKERITVYADHDAIYQVFYNLCHNAIKFSYPRALLRIRICEEGEHKVRVSVYNDGPGIPQEDLPFVFDRFYKSDKSRGLDKNGAGLGLFISKTIITSHGEQIGVLGEEGKNCDFFFTLSSLPPSNKETDAKNDAAHRRRGNS